MIKNIQEEQEYQNIYESDDYRESYDSKSKLKHSLSNSIRQNVKRNSNNDIDILTNVAPRINIDQNTIPIVGENEEVKIENFELFFPDFYDLDFL